MHGVLGTRFYFAVLDIAGFLRSRELCSGVRINMYKFSVVLISESFEGNRAGINIFILAD